VKKKPNSHNGESGGLFPLTGNHTEVLISQRAEFSGTDNPRHLRVIAALRVRAQPRESLDRVAGASNSPDLIAELRRRHLDVPCTRVVAYDRDGREVLRGVYHLSARDRRKLKCWAARITKRVQS
jgi:hypothetical protein